MPAAAARGSAAVLIRAARRLQLRGYSGGLLGGGNTPGYKLGRTATADHMAPCRNTLDTALDNHQ